MQLKKKSQRCQFESIAIAISSSNRVKSCEENVTEMPYFEAALSRYSIATGSSLLSITCTFSKPTRSPWCKTDDLMIGHSFFDKMITQVLGISSGYDGNACRSFSSLWRDKSSRRREQGGPRYKSEASFAQSS